MKVRTDLIKNYILVILIFILTLLIYTVDAQYSESKVLVSNLLIIILSLGFMLSGDNYPFSLNKIFMLFSFFFFGIAPAIQYQHGRVLWGGLGFSSNDYFHMNLLIIFIVLIYQGVYLLFSKVKIRRTNHISNKPDKKTIIKENILVLVALVSLVITLYTNSFNFINIFFRAGGEVSRLSMNQSIYLIYTNFIRPLPIISLIVYKINHGKSRKIELILWAIVLISNFPTSRARFYIGALYIPLLIIYFYPLLKKHLMLNKILIIGFLLVFPVLDQARRFSSFEDFVFKLDFQMFLQGHFDSYQMFMRTVSANFVTGGRQLLGSLLFFVPRSIWPNKPIGSGYLVSHTFNLSYDNISMNFFGEGYINFGYVGILIFIFILAFINARLDKKFWYYTRIQGKASPYYLLLLGLQIFILRGDLLSSIAFTTGLLASVYFINVVAVKERIC